MKLIQNWLGIAAIILLCLLVVRAADARHYESVVGQSAQHGEDLWRATYRIGVVNVDGNVTQGTAFHIGGGYFVTAGHVVAEASFIAFMNDDGSPVLNGDMYVIKSSYVAPGEPGDWAILKAEHEDVKTFPALEVNCEYEGHTGDIGLTYGYPGLGPAEGVSAGLLAGFTPGTWYTTQATGPGASGSAILVDGKVIGILVAGPDMPGLHFIVWAQPISDTPACGR